MYSSRVESLKPRNSGIWGYMRDSHLTQTNKKSNTRDMTTADHLHFIRNYVAQYKAATNEFMREQFHRKAIHALSEYNECATKEKKPTYTNVRDLLMSNLI